MTYSLPTRHTERDPTSLEIKIAENVIRMPEGASGDQAQITLWGLRSYLAKTLELGADAVAAIEHAGDAGMKPILDDLAIRYEHESSFAAFEMYAIHSVRTGLHTLLGLPPR